MGFGVQESSFGSSRRRQGAVACFGGSGFRLQGLLCQGSGMWVQVSRRVQAALALCFGWGNMSGFKLMVSVGTAPTEARTGGIIGNFYINRTYSGFHCFHLEAGALGLQAPT